MLLHLLDRLKLVVGLYVKRRNYPSLLNPCVCDLTKLETTISTHQTPMIMNGERGYRLTFYIFDNVCKTRNDQSMRKIGVF